MGCVLLASLLPCHVHAHVTFRDLVPNGLRVPDIVALGHQDEKHGGGALNEFGAAFRDADYKWTRQLCEADSDGDGVTNGMELGDPCCMWSEGKTPLRAWQISHPGDKTKAARVDVNCSQIQLENPFWDFYFADPVMVAKAAFAKSMMVAKRASEDLSAKKADIMQMLLPRYRHEFEIGVSSLQVAKDNVVKAKQLVNHVTAAVALTGRNVMEHRAPGDVDAEVFLILKGSRRRYESRTVYQACSAAWTTVKGDHQDAALSLLTAEPARVPKSILFQGLAEGLPITLNECERLGRSKDFPAAVALDAYTVTQSGTWCADGYVGGQEAPSEAVCTRLCTSLRHVEGKECRHAAFSKAARWCMLYTGLCSHGAPVTDVAETYTVYSAPMPHVAVSKASISSSQSGSIFALDDAWQSLHAASIKYQNEQTKLVDALDEMSTQSSDGSSGNNMANTIQRLIESMTDVSNASTAVEEKREALSSAELDAAIASESNPALDTLEYILQHPLSFLGDVARWASAPSTEMASPTQQIGKNIATIILVTLTLAPLLSGTIGDLFSRLTVRQLAALLLASALWTDIASGMLHIVLDNPKINHWPIIGPEAAAFQGHHFTPSDIVTGKWFDFLREHHLPAVAASVSMLFSFRTRPLHAFFLLANIQLTLMMASHRWSHTVPSKTPYVVRLLQDVGFLMSHAHHSRHHVSYDNNFAIYTGWSNPCLNFITTHIWGHDRTSWVILLAVWGWTPLFIAAFFNQITARSKWLTRLNAWLCQGSPLIVRKDAHKVHKPMKVL